MTVAAEQERIETVFEQVEEIEQIADTLAPDDERRARLLRVAKRFLSGCAPVRPRIAAVLLQLSEPTIRAWARQGVLTSVPTRSPRLVLDPSRLHAVLHLVRDLQRSGQTNGLLEAVWYRLSDHALLEREDLAESLKEMRSGRGREVDPDELSSS